MFPQEAVDDNPFPASPGGCPLSSTCGCSPPPPGLPGHIHFHFSSASHLEQCLNLPLTITALRIGKTIGQSSYGMSFDLGLSDAARRVGFGDVSWAVIVEVARGSWQSAPTVYRASLLVLLAWITPSRRCVLPSPA